jgi:hypothetical protein
VRALALALAVLLCAACGSTASKSAGGDPVAAAAKKTRERGGTYTVAIDFSKVSKTGGKYNGRGSFDGDGNFTLNVIYKGMPIHAVAALNSANHMIVYLKSVAFTGQLPEDKTWVAADMTRLVEQSGTSTKALDAVQSPGSDPTQVLGMLSRASSGTRRLGEGTVAGVHVVRYRVTLDLAKASKEPGVAGPEAAQLERTAKAPRIPVDVSIDDDGYVRAIDEHVRVTGRIAFRVPQLGSQQAIEAPPSDEVFDVTDQIPSS